eukprot:1378414-Rhodomonas_salina.1
MMLTVAGCQCLLAVLRVRLSGGVVPEPESPAPTRSEDRPLGRYRGWMFWRESDRHVQDDVGRG